VVGAPVVALVIGEGTAGRRRAAPAPA
jgi:hypothetical protein